MQAFTTPAPLTLKGHKPQKKPTRCRPTSLQRLANKKVLVTGATGATGRLICASLSARGAKVYALVRPKTYMHDRHRVNAIKEICPSVIYRFGDLRDTPSIKAAVQGMHGVVSCAGTRNFEGADPNRPEVVDFRGIQVLTEAFLEVLIEQELVTMMNMFLGDDIPETSAQVLTYEMDCTNFVLVSSLGVTRPERFPQLQAMGNLLTYKLCGEDVVRKSGCPFTIVRPGGFIDAPAGNSGVIIDQGDRIAGSISRADVAEICAEAIFRKSATNLTFECVGSFSSQGDRKKTFEPYMFDGLSPDDV